MKFLKKENLLEFNRQAIDKFGGTYNILNSNIKNEEALDFVVEMAQHDGYYPTMEHIAAFYLCKINTNHIFHDGNKRTALAALEVFLGLNGFQLKPRILPAIFRNKTIPQTEDSSHDKILECFMVEIASSLLDFEDVLFFIQQNIEPL